MNKLKIAASALGIFTGLGGASHGPGEMLLGSKQYCVSSLA